MGDDAAATNSFLSITDSIEDDFELSTVCHRPESMDKLQEQTKFTKKELQVLYRGFKNVGLHGPSSALCWMEIRLVSQISVFVSGVSEWSGERGKL